MKRILIPLFLVIILGLLFTGCSGGSQSKIDDNPDDPLLDNGPKYYVDQKNGNDQNPGTSDEPWATIQHAADNAIPGDTIIVRPGSYGRTSIKTGGNASEGWITFRGVSKVDKSHIPSENLFDANNPVATPGNDSINAVTRGFVLASRYGSDTTISNVRIMNFEITAVQKDGEEFSNRGGIYLSKTENIEIVECLFHDINGPKFNSNGIVGYAYENRNIRVLDNLFWRVQGIAISASGENWTVEGNRISHGLSHRTDTGEYNMGDTDGIRFFGSEHVFRNNFIYDFFNEEQGDADPHIDGFQTYSNNGDHTYNILIERNWVENVEQLASISDFSERDGGPDLVHSITFRGNVAYGMRGCALGIDSYCNDFILSNNTFARGRYSVGNGFRDKILPGLVFENNILYEPSTTQISDDAQAAFWDYNLHYPDFGYPAKNPNFDKNSLFGIEPLFIDPDNPRGPDGIPFTADDGLRLQPNSPAIGKGRNGQNIGAF